MAIFMGIHKMPAPVDENIINEGWSKYKEACAKRGLAAIRVDYNAQKGVGHCLTEAGSEDEVRDAHQDINMLPEEIFEVKTLE